MILRFCILIAAVTHFSLWPEFCEAQGNTNTSTGPCGRSGECGAFGSCNAQDSTICSCLPGFTPRNAQEWVAGNWSSGCERRANLSCANGATNDGFWKLQSMKISGYSTRFSGPEDQCEGICLRNCSCIAYAYDGGIGCMFWSSALIDVQKISNGLGSDLSIRVSASDLGKNKISTFYFEDFVDLRLLFVFKLSLCHNQNLGFYFLLSVNCWCELWWLFVSLRWKERL